MQYKFPVEYMLHVVQASLPRMQTVDLLKGFELGLKNEIQLVDRDGAWTTMAGVSPSGQVVLSVTYSQFLLLLCHVGLIVHDRIAVASEVARMTDVELEQYKRELTVDCPLTRFLKDIPDYDTAVRYSAQLINIAKPLLTAVPITDGEYDAVINGVDYGSPLVTRANSLCIYGIDFILLHEASHVILGQDLSQEGNVEEETAADHHAFWSMFSDLDGKERNTAMMGCICALVSLLFYNPTLEPDGVHPREDNRLFAFYDILKEEKSSYTEMIVILLAAWAATFHVEGFPVLEGSYEGTLNKQRAFLARIGK